MTAAAFYGFNRTGARISEGGIAAFSETDFIGDLKRVVHRWTPRAGPGSHEADQITCADHAFGCTHRWPGHACFGDITASPCSACIVRAAVRS
ncbi:hypothetical protein [Acidisphaera rubrifaciens]|uniref:hypothetical protein n=1 Tax=Acidisphaera rubrifaciens TaxID=50715 RepID=UPI00066292A8|nr:hypothetical protein [Acidisphaera rubrifaciens]